MHASQSVIDLALPTISRCVDYGGEAKSGYSHLSDTGRAYKRVPLREVSHQGEQFSHKRLFLLDLMAMPIQSMQLRYALTCMHNLLWC